MPKALLIIGATSDIGSELARKLCPGRPVILAARRPAACTALKQELLEIGAKAVHIMDFEATDLAGHRALVKNASKLAPIEVAVVAFGILGDAARSEHDEAHVAEIATIDYTAQISMLTVLADEMPAGTIVCFSSIAGWRARRANYVYGSTKAGLDAFAQGLADRLHGSALRLLIARPGFVIGSMTTGMKPAPMSVYPTDVADAIVQAMSKHQRSATLWIPGRLRILAWIMRLVPRPIWRHMPR